MKTATHLLSILTFGFICSTAVAANLTGKVKLLSHEVSGSYLQLVDDSGQVISTNPGNCSKNDLLHLPIKHANYTVLSSSLLMAQTSQQQVTLELDGCEQDRNKVAFLRFGDWSGITTGTPTQAPQEGEAAIVNKNLVPEKLLFARRFYGSPSSVNAPKGYSWEKVVTIEGRGYINLLEIPRNVNINLIIDGNTIFQDVHHYLGSEEHFAIINEKSDNSSIPGRFYFNKKLELEVYVGFPNSTHPAYSVRYNVVKLAD